ncbi:PPOX class F420-dependent oxidoreductase [Planosporangium thailandense]|uniref:PPOX class F420-dependent oxidoreductase n=1 Tax=Planosporangium thailandense TaxID=765197 RepID=A0ABX0XV35_9ACTN|nr:PPOX class F420-dependent oxidoreductase [Planosporangium thailandense]NJC69144.1 PPOX class F420-dependent oxidoreductase [Planosporangium thailandense]
MTRDEAIQFLAAGTRTGKLATASASGAPHVSPIWFLVDGDDLVFTTGEETVKGRHLRANPRAALAVDLEEYPYTFVVVRGPVAIEPAAPDLLEWATRLAERYVPEGRAAEFGRRNAVPGELLCRLRIDRLSGARDIAL